MNESILSLKLKEYRISNSLTQQELAEILEVSDKSISKWELGKTYPSKKNIIKIAELLHISIELLLLEEVVEDKQKENRLTRYIVPLLLVAVFVISAFNFISLQTITKQSSQINTQEKQIQTQQVELDKTYVYSAFIVLAPNTPYSEFTEYLEDDYEIENLYVNNKLEEFVLITFYINAHNNDEMNFIFDDIKTQAPHLTNAEYHLI